MNGDGSMQAICRLRVTRQRLRRWVALLVCLALFGSAQAQTVITSYDVEAAYLYNFGKFVRWPADPNAASAPFTICILGDDPFGEKLDSLVANELMEGRPIATKHLSSVASTDACQIVFLGLTEQPRLTNDLAVLSKRPILTVSNLPAFLEHGGMIQFLEQNNRVRFAVNLAPAEQTGLTLSSELLKVAVYVTPVEAKP
jgi:hypothetical protein